MNKIKILIIGILISALLTPIAMIITSRVFPMQYEEPTIIATGRVEPVTVTLPIQWERTTKFSLIYFLNYRIIFRL